MPAWLNVSGILGAFSEDAATAAARYLVFVREGLGRASVWNDLKAQAFLGGDAFLQSLQAYQPLPVKKEAPRAQRRALGKPLQDLVAAGAGTDRLTRNAAICAAFATGQHTMQDIAKAFGLHYATISRVISGNEKC